MKTEDDRELTPTESPVYASVVPVTFLKWGPRHKDGYRTSFESEVKTCLVWEPQPPEIENKGDYDGTRNR